MLTTNTCRFHQSFIINLANKTLPGCKTVSWSKKTPPSHSVTLSRSHCYLDPRHCSFNVNLVQWNTRPENGMYRFLCFLCGIHRNTWITNLNNSQFKQWTWVNNKLKLLALQNISIHEYCLSHATHLYTHTHTSTKSEINIFQLVWQCMSVLKQCTVLIYHWKRHHTETSESAVSSVHARTWAGY